MCIEEKKELVFDHLYESAQGRLGAMVISEVHLAQVLGLDSEEVYACITRLNREGLIEILSKDGAMRLTTAGQVIGQDGGYQIFLDKQREEVGAAKKREQLQDRLLENQLVEAEARLAARMLEKQRAFFETTTAKNQRYMWVSIVAIVLSVLSLVVAAFK